MDERRPLSLTYETVPELIELVTYAVESISLGFDRWDDEYVSGPSLYFVIVAGVSAADFADPLGENRWPVETCRLVEDLDAFVDAAWTVALEHDGAVMITADGTVQEQMVRIKTPGSAGLDSFDGTGDTVEYADWMGTKHMSALEISLREDVLGAVTLSEENGRMTLFSDGDYQDYEREELGEWWPSMEWPVP